MCSLSEVRALRGDNGSFRHPPRVDDTVVIRGKLDYLLAFLPIKDFDKLTHFAIEGSGKPDEH